MTMSNQRNITFIDHFGKIDNKSNLKESKLRLNKSGTMELPTNVCYFLLQQD